jgi:hypothetical protein
VAAGVAEDAIADQGLVAVALDVGLELEARREADVPLSPVA